MRPGPSLPLLLAVALSSCVRLGGSPPADRDATPPDLRTGEDIPGLPDAPMDAGADEAVDAAVDAGIDPLAPFGAAQLVSISSSVTEDDPTLTSDMLEIYFNRAGDIWRAERSSLGSAWSEPAVEASLSSTSNETNPEITGDGLTIYFASDRAHPLASGGHDIYRATRPTRGATWSAAEPVTALNTAADDHPGISTDDRIMIIASTRPGILGEHDFFETSRASAGAPWGPVVWVKNVSSVALEVSPWIDGTGTVLYYSSNRGGLPEVKIWAATRGDPTQPFSAPQLVGSLDVGEKEEDPWLSQDLRTIYFSRRSAGRTDMDLFTAQR